MRILSSLSGVVNIRFEHAAIKEIINSANNNGIVLYDLILLNELTAEVTLRRLDYQLFASLVEHRGGAVTVLNRAGLYWTLYGFRKRTALLLGLLFFVFLVAFLPTRILFVAVEGNHLISAETIKSSAEETGIYFGASRRTVKSERVKNALLSSVPQLQWAGVNTYGCVAVISVRERNTSDAARTSSGITGVVARRDGVIKAISASSGNVLCRVGQSVKTGQLLVSGYTDCGISVKVSPAEAEIYAQTLHNISARMPLSRTNRESLIERDRKISLIIGKKLINLFKGSGISDTTCVKIYEKRYLTLPGGFMLPLGYVIETQIVHKTKPGEITVQKAAEEISKLSNEYLLSTMIAGDVLYSQIRTRLDPGLILLTGEYGCVEMIGQTYNEEIIKGNE